MNELCLRNRQRQFSVRLRHLRAIAVAALEDVLNVHQYQLGVHLVGPRAMARVNESFLGHEGPTDVITFDHGRGDGSLYGEIFICPDEALRQAVAFDTSWQSELVRYLVHGVLHLRGYDDTTTALRRVMKRQENRAMRRLTALFPLNELGSHPRVLPRI